MYFVYEKYIVGFQRSEESGQITRLVEDGTGSDLKPHAKLIGYDIRQRGLTQPRRAMQQRMIQGLAAQTSCSNEDAQILHHLVLTAKAVERQGA